MTSIELLVRWLAVIALALGALGIVGAVVAEVGFRLTLARRRDRLQDLRRQLDVEPREPSDHGERSRALLLRDAEAVFAGILARDLDRDPQLAELFEDVCRRLGPTDDPPGL